MVRISKSTEYALAAIKHLAQDGGTASVRDLSERYNLPSGLLAKVLQRLASAGIVESVQGARGGYSLIRQPDELTFLELCEAVDGRYRFATCESDGRCEHEEQCTVSGPVHEMGERITEFLAQTRVGGLLALEETHR
jgi:Rrf2 family protein